jgi:hypothetical protein
VSGIFLTPKRGESLIEVPQVRSVHKRMLVGLRFSPATIETLVGASRALCTDVDQELCRIANQTRPALPSSATAASRGGRYEHAL